MRITLPPCLNNRKHSNSVEHVELIQAFTAHPGTLRVLETLMLVDLCA